MSINRPLFDSIYQECCDIIKASSDKQIFNKRNKLDTAYELLCKTENCELQEFYSIVHELRTYRFLCEKGLTLSAQNDNHIGPDFLCDELGYIECVSITKGEAKTECRKYVDACLKGTINRYKSAFPRITSAIVDKKNKYENYLSKYAINSQLPCIIAINTSIFSNEFHSDLIVDLFLKILYGIGCQTISFGSDLTSTSVESEIETHQFDDIGQKSFEKELQVGYFSQDSFRDISAIIVENNSIGEKIENKYFRVFLNPLSIVPLQTEKLKAFIYFQMEEYAKEYVQYKWYNPIDSDSK